MPVIEPHDASILFVEDNPDNMFLLKTILETYIKPKFVDGRPSGAQLFGLLASKPKLKPDLILLDLQIPHEDGYTILEQIRKRPLLRNAIVVAVTANVMPSDVERCRKAGFNGFIGKPIRTGKLEEQIRRILGGEEVWEPR
jgi:two-component system cell cycle response regulator DivK